MPRYKQEEEKKEPRLRVGRPTTSVEDGHWKSVKLPPEVWDKLNNTADEWQEPIYGVISRVVEESLGPYKVREMLSLSDALLILGRQLLFGKKQISPYMVVTAIRKGKVYGERRPTKTITKTVIGKDGRKEERKVGMDYKWFVDMSQLYRYLSKQPSIRKASQQLLKDLTKKPKLGPPLPDI